MAIGPPPERGSAVSTPQPPTEWYYRRDGQTVGPVGAEQLRGLLAMGHLQPRQAVWRRESQRTLFIPAEAACTEGKALER